MPSQIRPQLEELSGKAVEFANTHGIKVVAELQKESALLLEWLGFLSISQRTGIANSLLDGASSSVRECAACLGLGLVRPALFSMRTQIDLLIAWLYFKDHPVEWNTVNDVGSGYKLKREVFDYLGEHCRGFTVRHKALAEVTTRRIDDPYRLLSAHVHAQSVPSLPAADKLGDVVHSDSICHECARLASDVCEYLSDVLASVYGPKWAALPSGVRASVERRLNSNRTSKERFFQTV